MYIISNYDNKSYKVKETVGKCGDNEKLLVLQWIHQNKTSDNDI